MVAKRSVCAQLCLWGQGFLGSLKVKRTREGGRFLNSRHRAEQEGQQSRTPGTADSTGNFKRQREVRGRYSEPQNPAKVTHGCINARSLVVPQWVDTVKQEQHRA